MGYFRTSPPAVEPVTLDQAKDHLYLESDAQNARVTSLIMAARSYFETQTNRALISQGWTVSFDRYPVGVIDTPIGRVISVDALKFTDTDDVVTTVDPAAYSVDLSGARARLTAKLFEPWPWTYATGLFNSARRIVPNAVTIDFTAGYGADPADVPEDIGQAILLIVAHWFSTREPVITGVRAAAVDVPMSATAIMDAYRIPTLG